VWRGCAAPKCTGLQAMRIAPKCGIVHARSVAAVAARRSCCLGLEGDLESACSRNNVPAASTSKPRTALHCTAHTRHAAAALQGSAHSSAACRRPAMELLQLSLSLGSPNCAARRVAGHTRCACMAALALHCCKGTNRVRVCVRKAVGAWMAHVSAGGWQWRVLCLRLGDSLASGLNL
jgi:hypothetical protein